MKKMKSDKIFIIFALLFASILVLSACTTQVTKTVAPRQDLPSEQVQPSKPAQQSDNVATAPTLPTLPTSPDLAAQDTANTIENANPMPTASAPIASVKEFALTANKFEFIPSTVNVNKGDTVVLKITSADVAHGFNLAEFNIREDIVPGKETTITFVADKTGKFSFYCDVFCGSGHKEMKGSLIVS